MTKKIRSNLSPSNHVEQATGFWRTPPSSPYTEQTSLNASPPVQLSVGNVATN
jgi:hypothetical protein